MGRRSKLLLDIKRRFASRVFTPAVERVHRMDSFVDQRMGRRESLAPPRRIHIKGGVCEIARLGPPADCGPFRSRDRVPGIPPRGGGVVRANCGGETLDFKRDGSWELWIAQERI